MQPLNRRHWLGQLGIAAFSLGFGDKKLLNRGRPAGALFAPPDNSHPNTSLQRRTLDQLPKPLNFRTSADTTLIEITVPSQARYDKDDSPLICFLGPLLGDACNEYRLVPDEESTLTPRVQHYVRPMKGEVRIRSSEGETSLSILLPEQLSLMFSSVASGTLVTIDPGIVTVVNGTAGHAKNQRFLSGYMNTTRVQYKLKCVSFPRWETAINVSL
jgi:hypothetical protein